MTVTDAFQRIFPAIDPPGNGDGMNFKPLGYLLDGVHGGDLYASNKWHATEMLRKVVCLSVFCGMKYSNRQPGGLMPKDKTGAPKTFRPVGKTAERLDYAAKIGVNVNQVLNRTLEKHLLHYLEPEIKARKAELHEVLGAPLP